MVSLEPFRWEPGEALDANRKVDHFTVPAAYTWGQLKDCRIPLSHTA